MISDENFSSVVELAIKYDITNYHVAVNDRRVFSVGGYVNASHADPIFVYGHGSDFKEALASFKVDVEKNYKNKEYCVAKRINDLEKELKKLKGGE